MIFYLSVFVMLSASCSKDTIKPNKEASEYFPNTIGDYWEYDVYDSLNNNNYTLKVEIIDSIKLSDHKYANIWKYQYPNKAELRYIRIESDSVKVYDSLALKSISYINYPLDLFILPFYLGENWKSKNFVIDTFFVDSKSDILINANTYINCFFIKRKNIAYNYHLDQDIFFKENIGVVQFYQKEFDLSYIRKEKWLLKKYTLK